jgi:plastocyanin
MQLQQNNSALYNSISYLSKISKTQPRVITPRSREEGFNTSKEAVPSRSAIDSSYISQFQNELHMEHAYTRDRSSLLSDKEEEKGSDKEFSGASSAIPRGLVPVMESKTYKITIKNNAFIPDNLKIEKGSIVEWRVISDGSDFSHNSLYDSGSRKHVISFDSI